MDPYEDAIRPGSPRGRAAAALAASTDMEPVMGSVDVDIPVGILWKTFADPSRWPRWNDCMCWAKNHDLVEGDQLVWCFNPIRRSLLYRMPAFAEIIEVEENRRVTWEVSSALPGFFAHHTYSMEDLGGGRTRFGSWEKACGETFRRMRRFWMAHFTFVKDSSLEGVRRLERIYRCDRHLDVSALPAASHAPWAGALAAPLVWVAAAVRLYDTALRFVSVELAPGVFAVLGGCNSLVVTDGGEALVVDPKFLPLSWRLHRWIDREVRAPVTRIVNTHHHWDHTQGNVHYPGATITARAGTRDLMLASDARFWRAHAGSLPTDHLETSRKLRVGQVEIEIHPSERAHTSVDLWVYVKRGHEEIVAVGDIAFKGCYPFIDTSDGGTSLPGTSRTLRELASLYPRALFIPGHGALATAGDLVHYARYLDALHGAVLDARRDGLSETRAAGIIRLPEWRLSALPIFHYGTLVTSAEVDLHAAYRLLGRSRSSQSGATDPDAPMQGEGRGETLPSRRRPPWC
jgi:glyoxylase-like metal-dependent hydrolase (beta-lactamase superfamily II)